MHAIFKAVTPNHLRYFALGLYGISACMPSYCTNAKCSEAMDGFFGSNQIVGGYPQSSA